MYAICYEEIEIKYFDNWHKAEDYLFEVYEKNNHTGFYIKEIDKQ